jgi:hypothetical protein
VTVLVVSKDGRPACLGVLEFIAALLRVHYGYRAELREIPDDERKAS